MCHSLDWYVGVANLIQDFVLKLWKFYLGFKDIIAGLTVPKCITVNEICPTQAHVIHCMSLDGMSVQEIEKGKRELSKSCYRQNCD